MTCKGPNENSATHFFKIITKPGLEAGKLRIPNGFTRSYGGDLSNPMFLKTPDGTEWKIYLNELDGGDILFQNGWKEFATYHSLGHGHLVLFQFYKGTSHFGIHIFDKSTFEIEYPSYENQDEQTNSAEIGDDSVEMSDEIPTPRKKAKLKSPMSRPKPHKKLRRSITEDRKLDGPSEGVNSETTNSLSLMEANEFTPKNPFFIINLKPDKDQRYRPTVPVSFIKKYLKQKETIMLQFEKKLWPVKLIGYPHHGTSGRLSRGWGLFARESELVGGDVCVFELINEKDPVLDVHIYRGH